jgi:hypothetical protein
MPAPTPPQLGPHVYSSNQLSAGSSCAILQITRTRSSPADAVGNRVTPVPPHRSRRAAFPHRAPIRRVSFRRNEVSDHGRAVAPRVTVRNMLPSTLSTASASATLSLSRLNIPLRMIAVYASRPPSPTTTQHSLQGGTLLPYPRRTFTGWNAPASPGALVTDSPTPYVLMAESLAELQAQLPSGLVRVERQPADLPEVVEIWFPA